MNVICECICLIKFLFFFLICGEIKIVTAVISDFVHFYWGSIIIQLITALLLLLLEFYTHMIPKKNVRLFQSENKNNKKNVIYDCTEAIIPLTRKEVSIQ